MTDRRAESTAADGRLCTFVEAWRGECGNEAVSNDPSRCEEHVDETCRCGKPAIKECANTFGLVCGEPRCENCGCTMPAYE